MLVNEHVIQNLSGVCVCVRVLVKRELLHTGIIDLAHVEGMKQKGLYLLFLLFTFLK